MNIPILEQLQALLPSEETIQRHVDAWANTSEASASRFIIIPAEWVSEAQKLWDLAAVESNPEDHRIESRLRFQDCKGTKPIRREAERYKIGLRKSVKDPAQLLKQARNRCRSMIKRLSESTDDLGAARHHINQSRLLLLETQLEWWRYDDKNSSAYIKLQVSEERDVRAFLQLCPSSA